MPNVVFEGLVIASIGVTAGVVIGFACARVIGRFTTEIQLPGVLPLVASAAVILAAAGIASALPAARAANVSAVQALRSE